MRSPHPSTYTNTVLNFLPAHTHRHNHTKGKRRFLQPRTKPIKKLKDKYTHTLAKSYKHYKLAVAHTHSHTHSYSQKSSLLNTGHKSSQHTKVLRKFVQQIFSFKLPFFALSPLFWITLQLFLLIFRLFWLLFFVVQHFSMRIYGIRIRQAVYASFSKFLQFSSNFTPTSSIYTTYYLRL